MNALLTISHKITRALSWRSFGLALLLSAQPLNLCHAAGTVFAWGANDALQSQVPAGLGNVIALAAGESHSLALRSDGTVAAWGFNVYGQASVPANLAGVAAIAARVAYSMALQSNGTVVVWGNQTPPPAGLANVIAIAAGSTHSLALKKDGTVVSWGSAMVVPAGLSNVVAIAAGNNNSLALLANGTVVAWGDDSFGKSEVPPGATNVMAIAAGADHCLVLQSNRTVVAWGRDDSGQADVPAGLTGVLAISAGELHSVALKTDGTIVAWGDDTYGQTDVSFIGDGFVAVQAGGYHNLGIKTDGSPFILTQPASQTAGVNGRATFTVFAIGTQPFSYQWHHAGTNITGGGATLVVGNLTSTNSGSYTVTITNSRGSVTSQPALLAVVAGPPLVSTPPHDSTTVCGDAAVFSVIAGGSTNLGYQWEYQGQPITGATRNSLVVAHAAPTNAGPYSVVITNEFGSLSTGAVLTVTLEAPQFTSALAAYGAQGQPFNYVIGATHSPSSFGAQYLPAGLTLDSTNGIISGTPTESGGFFPILTASTPCSSGSQVLLLSIGPGVPVITSPALLMGVENGSLSTAIAASGAPTLFGATGLPSGINVDPLTGIISGAPTFAGEFDSTLWASNRWGIGSANMHSSFINAGIRNLTMDNVTYHYSSPYVLDFEFSLSTLSDLLDPTTSHGVVVNPQLLSAVALEDGVPTGLAEGGVLIGRGSSKQLKIYLILDFTESIASLANGDTNGNGISDAVDNMVAGAIDFVNHQTADTQVGVYEYHREDEPPNKVVGLTTDKMLLGREIAGIWTNYVQGFSAGSISWDAVYAAVQDLGAANPDELHYAVLISDGRDSSSTNTLASVIAAANTNNVRVYSVGFGVELLASALQTLSLQTQGRYHTATNSADVASQFAQVTKDAQAHYVLRWATLKRAPNPNSFLPGFTISYQGFTVTNPPNTLYLDTNNPVIDTNSTPPTTNFNFATNFILGPFSTVSNAGPPAVGLLRVVPEAEVSPTGMTLRSAYMPRYIRQLRLHYRANWPCTPNLDSTSPGEMLGGWAMTESDDGAGGKYLLLSSPDPTSLATSIPFASFGRLVTFVFQDIIDPSNAFSVFDMDNTLYTNTGGQSFVIENTNDFLSFSPALPHGTPIAWLINEGYTLSSQWAQAELLDPDHDGMPNWQEYRANTDPHDPNSKFVIRGVSRQLDGRFQITFSTSTNRTYRVEASTDLILWEPVEDGIPGVNQDVTITDARLIGNPDPIFYRVVVY